MEIHCYCNTSQTEKDSFMIPCQECKKLFHPGCLMSGRPSVLEGDVFFNLTCGRCAPSGEESVSRMKLQWFQIVSLSLYNMQLTSSGKYGYFRWKENICAHVDQFWNTYFENRKRSTLWYGTVAGTLSSYPTVFQSGTKELGESGWWKLVENKPPTLQSLTATPAPVSRSATRRSETVVSPPTMTEGLRSRTRSRPSSIQSAMELKAKRATTQESKEIRKLKLSPEMNQPKTGPIEVSTTDTSRESSPALKQQSDMKLTIKLSPTVTISSSSEEQLSTVMETPTTSRSATKQSKSASKSAKRKAKRPVAKVISLDTDEDLATSSDATIISDSEAIAYSKKVRRSSEDPVLILDSDSQQSHASSVKSEPLAGPEPLSEPPEISLFGTSMTLDDDLSDLEVDPCAITPPDSPTRHQMLSSGESSLAIKDIISAIPDRVDEAKKPDESDTAMYAHKKPTQKEAMTSRAIQSLTLQEPKPDKKKANTAEKAGNEKVEVKDTEKIKQKKKQDKGEELEESSESEDGASGDEGEGHRKKHGKSRDETLDPEEPPPAKVRAMGLFEERQLLQKLQSYGSALMSNPAANRLKRKLIIRQVKRERGLPVFDLDFEVSRMLQAKGLIAAREEHKKQEEDVNDMGLPTMRYNDADYRVLDRFQVSAFSKWGQYYQPKSFMNRLVGTEDDQLTSIRSPYTARMLKPFIRRDYETAPNKMKLLQEIQAYPHRNDPTWKCPPRPPIDYCYVRPQHIPSVNALCREFFWPGIDLSECLQYPDFSCVVLYRKFVIGFAFLVPDVKYNEAYISFIFTHPEWRGAGIATFMLYHLIQTCMGKDITLHVSASNPAMLLYQKFGFKPEEFILDFYDKYFPVDSVDCRHAFFLRLHR